MKPISRILILLAAGGVATSQPRRAHANVLGDIHRSITSLWGQKVQQQAGAKAALHQASAKKQRAEFLEDRLEKTAILLDRANDNYQNYSHQLAQTEARIVETRHRAQIATQRFQNHNQQFGLRLAALQKRGEPSLLSVILGSDSLAQLSRRTSFMRTLNDNDAQLQADLKADRMEMLRAQNELMQQWQDRVRLARAAHDEKARIAEGEREQQAVWREVNASKAASLRIAAAQRNASDSIGAQIRNLEGRKLQIIAQYEAQAARERAAARAAERAAFQATRNRRSRASARYASYSPASSVAEEHFADDGHDHSADGWVSPARGRISSRFGSRYHPVLKRIKLHTGEDIAAGYGSPFRAARGGRVLYSGWQKAYGKTVIIDNGNGTTTLYGHASQLNVRAGQSVKAGQNIGNVGSTGWSTGPHLHFEVRKNGRPVNPANFVR